MRGRRIWADGGDLGIDGIYIARNGMRICPDQLGIELGVDPEARSDLLAREAKIS